MRLEKVVFILGLLSVLIICLVCFYKDTPLKGKVESIDFLDGRIVIKLVGNEEGLVIFSERVLDIKEGEEILFWGKEESYKGERQIIVERLEKVIN
jgi:hypothetical protein